MQLAWKRQWTPLLFLFLILRLVYSALGGVMASRPDPEPLSGGPVFDAAATLLKPDQLSHLLVNVWSRWDTPYYLKIAAFGYDTADGTSVYMPLYPWLIRGLAFITGNFLLSALIISSISALAAFVLLYETARGEGNDDSQSLQTVLSFAFFPTAFFLMAAYTDSLFLALALGTWLAARRGRWLLAGALAALATLCRLQGALLTIVLLWVWLASVAEAGALSPLMQLKMVAGLLTTSEGRRSLGSALLRPDWIGVLFPGLTFILYTTWLTRAGLGSITQVLEVHWGIRTVMPWTGVGLFFQRLLSGPRAFVDFVDLMSLVIVMSLLLLGLRSLDPGLSLYAWASLALFFMRGTPPHLLDSFSRYMLAVFPAFMVIPRLTGRTVKLLAGTAWFALQIFLLLAFLDWRWIA